MVRGCTVMSVFFYIYIFCTLFIIVLICTSVFTFCFYHIVYFVVLERRDTFCSPCYYAIPTRMSPSSYPSPPEITSVDLLKTEFYERKLLYPTSMHSVGVLGGKYKCSAVGVCHFVWLIWYEKYQKFKCLLVGANSARNGLPILL